MDEKIATRAGGSHRERPAMRVGEFPTAAAQVARMLEAGRVVARTGESVPLRADSICLHGDRPDAAAFARGLRDTIEAAGFAIRTVERRA